MLIQLVVGLLILRVVVVDSFVVSFRNCTARFEPKCSLYWYIRYWNQEFHPHSADCYESPLRPSKKERAPYKSQRYVVFEPDCAGWNNKRMSFETATLIAHATGRTLVLPPSDKWQRLQKNDDSKNNWVHFQHFYDLTKLQEGMTIMNTHQFLKHVATIPGLLKERFHVSNGSVDKFVQNKNQLWSYMQRAGYVENWNPFRNILGFNISQDNPGFISNISRDIINNDKRYQVLKAAGNRVLRPYNQSLHNERLLFFPGKCWDSYLSTRLLTHFYLYMYWVNPNMERIYRRIARDRLHYSDNIFCAAGHIIGLIHQESHTLSNMPLPDKQHQDVKTLGGNTNFDATYFAMHIRRDDFESQYKFTIQPALEIWRNVQHLFPSNRSKILYISSDETNRSFFAPMMNTEFTVRFISDYLPHLKKDLPHFDMNHVPMVEQIICANAHTFVGTPFSTFTGYITRLRGTVRFLF